MDVKISLSGNFYYPSRFVANWLSQGAIQIAHAMALDGLRAVPSIINSALALNPNLRDFYAMRWWIVGPIGLSTGGMGASSQLVGHIPAGVAPILGYISGKHNRAMGIPFPIQNIIANSVIAQFRSLGYAHYGCVQGRQTMIRVFKKAYPGIQFYG